MDLVGGVPGTPPLDPTMTGTCEHCLFLCGACRHEVYDFMTSNSLNHASYMQKHTCAILINIVHTCLCHMFRKPRLYLSFAVG